MCRSEGSLSSEIRKKIALFASLPAEAIVSACDVDNIYKVPLTFREQGVDDFILEHFGVRGAARRTCRAGRSRSSARRTRDAHGADRARRQVRAARGRLPVGLRGAAPRRLAAGRARADRLDRLREPRGAAATDEVARAARRRRRHPDPRRLRRARDRGQDRAPRRSRASSSIPYLGICLGMQVAVAEFARHVAGMEGANSTEFDLETPYPVIDLLPEQKEVADLGGTMRLGADPIKLHDGTPRARDLRRGRRLRAPPPPLRGQQPAAQAPRRAPACASRAPRPTSASSR